jgi:hypothetical protein
VAQLKLHLTKLFKQLSNEKAGEKSLAFLFGLTYTLFMAQTIITEKELRMWSMDRPELNTLVDNVRFSPEDIEEACINVVDIFNIMPPPNNHGYTVSTFPSRALLALGVWGWLLRGAAIGEASNNMTYSADGVQVNDRDKAEAFTSLGNSLWAEFRELAQGIKLTQSINKVYGIKPSEYSGIYRS